MTGITGRVAIPKAIDSHAPHGQRMLDSRSAGPEWVRARLERCSSLLLIRLRSLGDSILTLPLIEALRQWRPDLQIDVLVESQFAPVFACHPAVRTALCVRSPNTHESGLSRLGALAEIRKRRYPAVINLHGGTTSLTYSLLSGAPLRIGQQAYRHAWTYNVRIPPASVVWGKNPVHTVEHQLTLPRWLGLIEPSAAPGTLHVPSRARDRIAERLRKAGMEDFILIHPTATLVTKQWPPGRFARLGDDMQKRYGLPVVYTAAPHENAILLEVGREAAATHHYWSDLPLEDLFALIERCRLFIGNDSGPTHAAAMLHKPVVVVWGSSNWNAWHPWNCEYELVRSDLPCMPCPGYRCQAFGAPRCILDIPIDRVLSACVNVLERG